MKDETPREPMQPRPSSYVSREEFDKLCEYFEKHVEVNTSNFERFTIIVNAQSSINDVTLRFIKRTNRTITVLSLSLLLLSTVVFLMTVV